MALKIRNYACANKDVLQAAATKKGTGPDGITQLKANDEARDWDHIVCQAANYGIASPSLSRLPGMKETNPNLKLFCYMNTTFTGEAPRADGPFPIPLYWKNCEGTEYLRSKWGQHAYLMRLNTPEWKTTRVNEAKKLVGYSDLVDGVFMDLAGKAPTGPDYVMEGTYTPPRLYKPRPCPGDPYTPAQWMEFTTAVVSAVKGGIGSTKRVFANGFDAHAYDVTRVTWDIGVSHMLDEGFLRKYTAAITAYPTEAEWLKFIRLLGPLPADQNNRTVSAIGMMKFKDMGTIAQFEAWREYGMATLLMGTDGGTDETRDRLVMQCDSTTYDLMKQPIYSPATTSWYEWEIGTPKTAAPTSTANRIDPGETNGPTSGSYYRRVYTDGIVFVNPSTTNAVGVPVPSDGTYKKTNGVVVSGTVTVPANTGMILFKSGGTAPSPPNNITGFAVGTITSSTVALSWNATSDPDGDLKGYIVEQRVGTTGSWTSIGDTTSTSWTASGLSASTTYQFRVRAYDAQNPAAYSAYAGPLSATTSAATDTTKPTTPGGVTVSRTSDGMKVQWTPSTDSGSGISTVQITRRRTSSPAESSATTLDTISATKDGASVAEYTDKTGTLLATYIYGVRTKDVAGNWSDFGYAAEATITDIVAPTWPSGAKITYTATESMITLTFPAASDDVAVDHYVRRRDGAGDVEVDATTGPITTIDATVEANQSYTYTVTPYDAAGNAGVALTAIVSTPSGGELRLGPIQL